MTASAVWAHADRMLRAAGALASHEGLALDLIADGAGGEGEDAAPADVPSQVVVDGLEAWERREGVPYVSMPQP